MASPIPPAAMGGGDPLAGPPPSPANQPQIVPPRPEKGPMPGGEPAAPQGPQQTGVRIGAEVDRALSVLAQLFPEAAQEFRAAQQALKSALAKALAGGGGPNPPASSPTSPGNSFPGSMSPPKF